jgi:hypothetical protein
MSTLVPVPRFATYAPLLVALAAGCGSGAGNGFAGEVGTFTPDSGLLLGAGDGGPSAPLDASIQENNVTVTLITLTCSGSCADVEAVASGGTPPYTFAWDDGSTSPTRHVCPTSSTRYHVTVTDTGRTGELAQAAQHVQAAVTADVLACPDGGVSEGGPTQVGDACSDSIQNPSFEGTPQTTNVTPWDAPAWQKCPGAPAAIYAATSSPLGPFGGSTMITPTDGQTEMWIQPAGGVFVPGPGGAGQALCSPIPAGTSMSFRIDARMVPVDDAGPPSQTFQVFGGNTACCDPAGCGSTASPLLFSSPGLTTSWSTYCVTLNPGQSTGSLTFTAAGLATNGAPHVVLDHIVPVAACP